MVDDYGQAASAVIKHSVMMNEDDLFRILNEELFPLIFNSQPDLPVESFYLNDPTEQHGRVKLDNFNQHSS
jgi:hypothetical protein